MSEPYRFRPLQRNQIPRPRIDESILKNFLDLPFVAKDLEVGAGVGWHALQRSQSFPERALLSIERTKEKFDSFSKRLENHGRPANLLALHADAIGVAAHFLPPEFFEQIFFLYPNPEPKNPSQRWIRAVFFELFLEALKPGGSIILATNKSDYKDEILELAPQRGLYVNRIESWTQKDKRQARSHFEKKYLERGERVWNLVLQKT